MRSLRSLPWLLMLTVLLATAGCIGSNSARKSPKPQHDSILASYMYMEANSRLQADDLSSTYYIMREAARLNPADHEITGDLGHLTTFVPHADSLTLVRAYDDMRRRFEANPSDYQNALEYAEVARGIMQRPDDVRHVYATLHSIYPHRVDFARPYAMLRARQYLTGDTSAVTDALRILDGIEQFTGLDAPAVVYRLQVLAPARDTLAMTREVLRYAATGPSDPQVNYIVGQLFDNLNRPDSAIIYYDRALAADSTFGEAVLARAEHFMQQGDSARYDSEVFRALKSQSLDFEPKLEILTNYVKALYSDEAHKSKINDLFEAMLDIHPGEAELHHLYGAYLAANTKHAAASEQFGYAMDLDPENTDYPNYAIQTAMAAGDTLQAVDLARTAMKRFPGNLQFPIQGSMILHLSNRKADALAMLDSTVITGNEPPRALSVFYQSRGDLQHAMGMVDSAFVSYENALKFDPNNAMALNNMAYYMSLADRDLPRAKSLIAKAVQMEPLNPTLIDTHAWVLYKMKDYEGARREIDEALRIYSESQYEDSVLSEPDSVAMQPDEAEMGEEVVQEPLPEPEQVSADIYDHAGDIYYMCGRKEEALRFWELALALDPNNPTIKKKVKTKKLDDTH